MKDALTIPTPEQRLRQEWAASLRDHLESRPLTRKQLRQALAERGVTVTHQAVSSWLRGETAPRPHHQAAIAAVLRVPAHRLFPLQAAA